MAFKMVSCPFCGADLRYTLQEGHMELCRKEDCLKLRIQRFFNFFRKIEVDSVKKKHIKTLLLSGRLSLLSDVYNLTESDFIMFPNISPPPVLNAISESRNITLDTLLTIVGIPYVSKNTAQLVAEYFKYNVVAFNRAFITTKSKLLSDIDIDQIQRFGSVLEGHIEKHFSYQYNVIEWTQLLRRLNLIRPKKLSIEPNPLFLKKKVFIAGSFLKYTHADLERLLRSMGATVVDTMDSHTDILLVGSQAANKVITAQELNIQIVTEKTFMEI